MTVKIPEPRGPIWLVVIVLVLESLDLIIKFLKEHRLRKQSAREEEAQESKNYVLKKCLQILSERQDKVS